MALITGLIFLVLLTLIGVTAMQTTTLDEKMAGNLRSENLAFQASEAALRAGESYLQSAIVGPFLTVKNDNGLYQPALSATTEWWEIADIWTAAGSRAYATTPPGVANPPRYIIEDVSYQTTCGVGGVGVCINIPLQKKPGGSLKLGTVPDVGMYRITARGTGGTDDSVVLLQSHFRR
jgi:type IV pilus assembly protein PilX